jgi:hypothetical protein
MRLTHFKHAFHLHTTIPTIKIYDYFIIIKKIMVRFLGLFQSENRFEQLFKKGKVMDENFADLAYVNEQ